MPLVNPQGNIREFAVVFDTNMIFVDKKDENAFVFSPRKEFVDFINFKKDMGITFGKLYFPQLCIDEIVHQKLNIFNQKKGEFEKLSKYFDLSCHRLKISERKIKDEIIKFCNQHFIQIIGYPTIRLSKLRNRAMKKIPPFHGTDQHSDYGFKDVLLWESVLAQTFESNGKIILCSSDKIFKEPDILEEFNKKHPNINITIISDWQELRDEYQSLHAEIIANANICSERLLAFFQDEYSNISKIIDPKITIKQVDPWVVECKAKVIQNGNEKVLTYFYDVRNQEYFSNWTKEDE